MIVATFDRPAALERCLASLAAQIASRTFEIVVVDNHPQSGLTAAVGARFPEFHWLQEPVAGLSRARNLGITKARGSVLVTTDDDVIAPADWLERLTTPLFSGEKGLMATTGNCLALKVETEAEVLFESYGGLRHGNVPAQFDLAWMNQWRFFFPQIWRIGTTANAAFRASVFRHPAVGYFEERLGAGSPAGAWEDLYLLYRTLRAGYLVRYLPEAQLRHAHREELADVGRQLCGYRRGEMAFLTLILLRHRDFRALSQALLWIPMWRVFVTVQELGLRLAGRHRSPFRMLCAETMAYFAGPWSLWRGHRLIRRQNPGRSP